MVQTLIRLLQTLSVLSILCYVYADEKPCTTHGEDKFFDLSPLKSSKDYTFNSSTGQQFFINVCRSVTTETWNIEEADDVAVFARHERGDFSLGSVNTTLGLQDGHPLLLLTNGSPCPNTEHMRAATVVRFICDTSVFAAGEPQLIAQLPQDDASACVFFLEWRTHYACPAGEAGGPGSIVAILATTAMVLMMLYAVGATLYNRYVLHLRGFDQIPRMSLFSLTDTLDFCHEWTDRICPSSYSSFDHHRGGWGPSTASGAGFERVPASDEERLGMLDEEVDDESPAVVGERADDIFKPSAHES